ncbi:SH3 domain-containing protein [Candidatus Poriferisocius sp.]|uniref:SH3 domain-containing protein n=1 Tax=Candidatus Poriferisocius sp. TaxID=3101276 RepID=UPI003B0150B4
MGIRAIVFCVAVAGLAFVALSLAGIVSTWGFDWVTIESEEPEPDSTPEAAPTATAEPLPEPVVAAELEIDPRYPPDTQWRVFDVPSALNVRAGPNTAHEVLGTASLDSTVTLTGQVVESPTSGTWVQVRTNTVTGWVFAAYLAPAG